MLTDLRVIKEHAEKLNMRIKEIEVSNAVYDALYVEAMNMCRCISDINSPELHIWDIVITKKELLK